MRSTRATAAVDRLNKRSTEHHYVMIQTGAGLFYLSEPVDGIDRRVTEVLGLDDFVSAVNGMGPQQVRRVTKNDAAFARQLVRKNES